MTKMLTITKMLMRIRMLVFWLSVLLFLVFLAVALFLLVFLLLTLYFLVFLTPAFLLLVFLLPALASLVFLPLVLPLRPFATGIVFHGPSLLFRFFLHFCSSPLFCLSSFSFLRSFESSAVSHQDLNIHSHHVTSISFSLMQVFKTTLLSLEEDYAIQHSISFLRIYRKRLQFNIDKANKNKLRYQPVAAWKEEQTVRLMFSC